MGEQLFVETTAISAVASQFDAGAELIDAAVRNHLHRLAFDGSRAGRVHVADGQQLRRALDRWAGELHRWSHASAEIAAALRAGARRYAEAEHRAASRVG